MALRRVDNHRPRRAALLSLLGKPPLSKPGTVYAYSNAGYVLAGLMAEEVTGQSWEELMQLRLFEPLGMKSAGFGPTGQSSTNRIDQPWGHRDNHGRLEPVQGDNAPCMGPAGTVHCSLPDWCKFTSLHLRAAEGKPRLLKPETFRTLHTPPPGSEYAGGWLVLERPWAHGLALSHNGSNTYWYASIWIAPAVDFATMVVTNQAGSAAESASEDATRELINEAFQKNAHELPGHRGSPDWDGYSGFQVHGVPSALGTDRVGPRRWPGSRTEHSRERSADPARGNRY